MSLDELREARAAVAACHRARARAELLADQIASEQQECRRLRDRLADERDDVEALERLSVSSLLARARGRLDDQLRGERAEVAEVEVELATRQASLARLDAEFRAARDRSLDLDAAQARLDEVVARRGQAISGRDDRASRELAELDARLAVERAARSEIVEAHQAAIGADGALERAIEAMSSARNWSRHDTWGGGEWLSSAIKHQRLDSSVELLAGAHSALLRLRSELGDAAAIHHPNLSQPSPALSTMDVWFDNVFGDLMVHRKISRSLDELRRAHEGVLELVARLTREERIATDRVAELEARRDLLLRSA